ncbi:MAG: GNAT family N-acetyltransferase [Chitinophagaceae bacterium]
MKQQVTIPFQLSIETEKVLLRPLHENDFNDFLNLAQDEEMWQYFTLNLANKSHLEKWMQQALSERTAGSRRPFTIIEKSTGKICGSTSIGNISVYDLRFEIGWSWLGKTFRSTGINRHAKFCMMNYGFEELNFERIEFKTDVQNQRARHGLINIGGVEEGILRSHMTMWNNRRRTSVYYSVLKQEWPTVKQTVFKNISHWSWKES